MIDIFEVNRKECARLLLEYPKWTPHGTFRPRPGSSSDNSEPVPGKDWQLESTLVEVPLFLPSRVEVLVELKRCVA
jgi:nuclear cap-binding protein subunit 1